jgi:outer membrane protein TolC
MKTHLSPRGKRRSSIFSLTAFVRNNFKCLLIGSTFLWAGTPLAAKDLVLTLEQAQSMAAEHSFQIDAAVGRQQAAEQEYRAARARRFPAVSLNAYSRYLDGLQQIDLPNGSLEIGTKEVYQADLRLALPLFTGGKLSGSINAQRESSAASAAELAAARLRVAYETRRSYLSLLLTHSLEAAARSSLSRIQIIREDVVNLADAGMADSVDLLEADQAVAGARRQVIDRQLDLEKAEAGLGQLIGEVTGDTITPGDSLQDVSDNGSIPQLPSAGQLQRPELRALRAAADASRYAIDVARANYFPDLTAYAGYTGGKPNRDFLGASWNDFLSAGLQLSWSFNLAGESIHRTAAAHRQYDAARAEYAKLEDDLLLQTRIALQIWKSSRESLSLAKEELRLGTRKFELAREQHRAGTLSVNRLLEMEAELNAAEDARRAALVRVYLAESDYLYTIGSDRLRGGL